MISGEILGKFQRLWAASMFIWSVSKPIVSKQNRDEARDLFGRMLVGVVLSLDRGHGCEVFNLGRGTPGLATTWNWYSKLYNTKTKESMIEQA
ncbi:unnamed protein product [Peronospora farinosa]|uniref:Uncharacterized protein n=1 Tax=Peronospora farinosa TaxID=134698 RepID=A0AAV0SUB8_9STRA|nr:unnamed protein product [Peronospora farinosa]